MTKTMSWATEAPRPFSATLLYFAAAVLQGASAVLARQAERTAAREAARAQPSLGVVEFHHYHREAGAPEGALYVNGELVGVIEGVTRL